jgi:hypothetical protein
MWSLVGLRGTQRTHTFAYPMASVMFFTLPLDTESSFASFLVVIHQFISVLQQRRSDCCCWPARVRRVTELRLAFLRTRNSWSLMTNSAFINSIVSIYIFYHLWVFVTDSFSATKNSVTAGYFKRTSPHHAILMTSCACATKLIVLWRSVIASRTFQINHRISCWHFLLILIEV